MKKRMTEPRLRITFWCVIIAFWIYQGAKAYLSIPIQWTIIGAAVFWIGMAWHEIWTAYDDGREEIR